MQAQTHTYTDLDTGTETHYKKCFSRACAWSYHSEWVQSTTDSSSSRLSLSSSTNWLYGNFLFHQEKMILDQRYADSLIHVLPGENLFDTYSRKLQIYKPIQTAPKKYTASGWTVWSLSGSFHGSWTCGNSGTCAWTIITQYSEFPYLI